MALGTHFLKSYATKNGGESTLASGISAAATVIALASGEGALFPTTYNGTADSAGDSTTLNSTGIGASGVAVGDTIYNATDDSYAIIETVSTDSVTTTALQGGADNTWDNSDEWSTNYFGVTLVQYATTGDDTTAVVQKEVVFIKYRDTDDLYVQTRGVDDTTAATYATGDNVYLYVKNLDYQGLASGLKDHESRIEDLESPSGSSPLLADGSVAVDNDAFLKGTDNAGTGTVDMMKVNASDEIEMGKLPYGPASTTPTHTDQLAPKGYVDDQVGGTFTAEAGEDILAATAGNPLAVFMCGDQNTAYHADLATVDYTTTSGSGINFDVYGGTYYAQNFKMDVVDKTTITYLSFDASIGDIDMSGMSSTGKIEIYEKSGDDITGSALATATIDNSSDQENIPLDASVELTASTEYMFMISYISGSGTGSDYIRTVPTSAQTWSGYTPLSRESTDGGGTWATHDATRELRIRFYGHEALTAGKLYISDKDKSERAFFDGFVSADVSSGGTATVDADDTIDGFTGLTLGAQYQIGNSGAIEAGSGTGHVGKATATDIIHMKNANASMGSATGSFSAAGTDVDIPEECGKVIISGGNSGTNTVNTGMITLIRGVITSSGMAIDAPSGSSITQVDWSVSWSGDTLSFSGSDGGTYTLYFFR